MGMSCSKGTRVIFETQVSKDSNADIVCVLTSPLPLPVLHRKAGLLQLSKRGYSGNVMQQRAKGHI